MKKLVYIAQISLFWFALCFATEVSAQQISVNGSVTDAEGNPVNGATVRVVENSEVTATSTEDGSFRINGEIGQHIEIKKENRSSGKLQISQQQMSVTLPRSGDAVAIGYGEYRSRDQLTSSVGVARSYDLSNSSVINPENTLYGKIPGLTILQNGGEPPTRTSLNIRGTETFRNGSVLILVDGFERPLSSLAPGEIESVSVLKDAASLAMYGQRGANGVILVTTKRGGTNTLRVNATYQTSITEPVGLPSFAEAPVYARAINEALMNDGEQIRYSQEDIQAFSDGDSPYLFPNVDWFDEVLRDNGARQNFNVSFDGGASNAKYFVMMNYSSDTGIFGPVDRNKDFSTQLKYGRFNFRSNLDVDITESLVLKLNAAGNIINKNTPGGGGGINDIFNGLYSIPSAAFPVKTPNNNWGGTQLYGNNPVALLTSTGFGSPNERELFLDGRLIKELNNLAEGLSAELAVSYSNFASYWEQKSKSFSYESVSAVRDESGAIVDTTSTFYGEDTELNYWSSFGNQRRSTDLLAKLKYQTNFGDDELSALVLIHPSTLVLDGQNNTFRRNNFAGNIQYGINSKYYVNLAMSYSGNNLLPEGDKYGFFPAISAAWIVSNEEFLQEVAVIDRLKLRASWGLTGNDLLPNDNPHLQTYSGGAGYYFTDNNTRSGGFEEDRLPTSNFTYEKSYKTNVGIEIGLLNKLDITADLFYAKRKDILTSTGGRISNVLGIAPPLETDGVVENRGIELDMNWQDNVGSDFVYHIGGQFSFARNKILEMNEAFTPYEYLKQTGESVGQRFGLEAIGFFEDQSDIDNSPRQLFSQVRPGDIKYRDQNGDGVINEFDVIPIGYSGSYPEIYFSASVGFNYKGIGVESLFQGTKNHTAYLNTKSVYWPLRNNNTISEYYYNNRWTSSTSASATLPRLTTEDNANNFRANDIWLADRSYIKLRSLEVSYSLPVSVIQPLSMQSVKIFARGMNLFSIDDIEVMDPEHLSSGYPLLRSYHLGLNIVF